jgi:glycosyltransferase involved in cell wall biosynthesis
VEATVVVETYNLEEGTSSRRLVDVLRAAAAMVEAHGDAELVVLDVSRDDTVWERLQALVPDARRVVASGLGYDGAKGVAAQQARGEYVVYLDADCMPEPGWLDAHLAVLRAGAPATCGVTRYDGGFFGALCTLLDFGFLLPVRSRDLDCYASNNSGFRRDVLLASPCPDGAMRCNCYAHAQELMRRGTPVRLVPEARVRHELPDFREERFRRGFDVVAALWVNPRLWQARLLRLGPFAAPLLYAEALVHDWKRVAEDGRSLGLSPVGRVAAALLAPVARLVDLAGMLRALTPGGRESGVGVSILSES